MFDMYDTIKALKEPDLHLIKDADTGAIAVRKRTRCELLPLYEQLSSAHITGIPEILSLEEYNGSLTVIRQYISGKPLGQLLSEGKVFSKKEAVDIASSLCDILTAIHSLIPPVIHRDIKPSNIILSDSGELYLIDFDAARQYKGDGEDTQHIGTHGYAAPEQYGFGETDARADIYAVGILLKELLGENIPTDLGEVISTCTRMDPAHRYQSAAALKKALGGKKSPIKRILLASAAALLCVSTVFLLSHKDTAADNTQIQAQDELSPTIQSVETPAPATPTPEPTPEPTPNPWLDITWPGDDVEKSKYDIESYADLKETLDYILENPDMRYELVISCDITAEESVTIPVNTRLYITPYGALRMAPGTTLVNGGEIFVNRGGEQRGTLQLMDDCTLYCVSRIREENHVLTLLGTLDCGKNVTITREEHPNQDGQYPLIFTYPKSIWRCEDESTLHISGYRYIFLNSKAEFPIAPFVYYEGEEPPADIRMTEINTVEEFKAAIEEASTTYSDFVCAIDIEKSMTIREDITVPDNVSLKLFTRDLVLTIADGGKLTVGKVNAQIEENAAIRVRSGGTLHYKGDNLSMRGDARIYADEGGTIICDYANVAEKIGLYD